MKTSGKKDMDYLGLGTTKELPENPDHGKQMEKTKKKKSMDMVIAILKARKAKK